MKRIDYIKQIEKVVEKPNWKMKMDLKQNIKYTKARKIIVGKLNIEIN